MRFFYADPGLFDSFGHHANTCRAVIREMKSRGIPAAVFACVGIRNVLRAELDAVPFFRHFAYTVSESDPVNGWRDVFDRGTEVTAQDLARLPAIGREDVLFCSTALPVMIMALGQWLAARPRDTWPQIVVELGTDTGLRPSPRGDGTFVAPDPRVDPRAVLYRHAGANIPKDAGSHLHLFYVDSANAELFSSVLQYPVHVLPSFYSAHGPLRRRGDRRPLTVGVLGHQQTGKGYHLVPEVGLLVLSARQGCRFLVHNSSPEQMPDLQQTVRTVAEIEPRFMVDERKVTPSLWPSLLDSIDLMLCPYDPVTYQLMPSGIAADAIANAIPVIAPAGTSLARMQREYQAGGAIFEGSEPEAIAAATIAAIDSIDQQADQSLAAASRWAARNGVAHAVDTLLSCAGMPPAR